MIVVRVIGGLGNQMFQYAAARQMAERLGVDLRLDLRGFGSYTLRKSGLENLHICARRATDSELVTWPESWRTFFRLLNKVVRFPSRFYFEPHYHYNPAWPSLRDGLHLNGYFQSEQYLQGMREQLRQEFKPLQDQGLRNRELQAQMECCDSVMIHVRRGDYLTVSQNVQIFGVCSIEYYRKAIDILRNKLRQPRFFVFAEDHDWARDNLPLSDGDVFVEGNHEQPEQDLYLMTRCRHHIIANSSFSWWGAWLADDHDDHVVIAPSPWFDSPSFTDADLIPSRWMRLPK